MNRSVYQRQTEEGLGREVEGRPKWWGEEGSGCLWTKRPPQLDLSKPQRVSHHSGAEQEPSPCMGVTAEWSAPDRAIDAATFATSSKGR